MQVDNTCSAAAIRGRGWRRRVGKDCSRDRCGPADAAVDTFTDDIVCGCGADRGTECASNVHATCQAGIAEPDERIAICAPGGRKVHDPSAAPAVGGRGWSDRIGIHRACCRSCRTHTAVDALANDFICSCGADTGTFPLSLNDALPISGIAEPYKGIAVRPAA